MIEQGAAGCLQRANSYRILADCYYRPDDELLKTLESFDPEAFEESLLIVVRSAPRADDIERHIVDYSKLFVGPFKLLAPPYGSVYLEDGKFMGDSTLDAGNLYGLEGLDIVIKDAPDHISVELEFMYFLVLAEAEARQNDNLEEAARLHDRQVSFLRVHLGSWVSEFAENIEQHSETEFYKTLGLATKNYILEDMARLTEESESGTTKS